MQKDLLYCAIDVSKDKLDLDAATLALPAQLGNDHGSFRQLIKAAKKYQGPVQFVFEATGPYHLGLALALWEAQIPLSILNPARVRHFAKAQGKAKTDPLDTQVIGDFARSFRPQPTPAPDPVRRELTELLQRRDGLIGSRAAEQNRLGQCRHKMIKGQIRRMMAQLAEQIDQIDGLMKKLVNTSQELKAKVKALCQVKGVGHLTAVTLLITLPELGTLGRNRIVRLVGLAPLKPRPMSGRAMCHLSLPLTPAFAHRNSFRTLGVEMHAWLHARISLFDGLHLFDVISATARLG